MSLRHDVATSDVPTLPLLGEDAAAVADQVITFVRAVAAGEQIVVELRDAHGNLVARSSVDDDRAQHIVADELLRSARLERCSDFITDPLGKTKVRRSIASVCPSIEATTSRYEQARSSAPQMAI